MAALFNYDQHFNIWQFSQFDVLKLENEAWIFAKKK